MSFPKPTLPIFVLKLFMSVRILLNSYAALDNQNSSEIRRPFFDLLGRYAVAPASAEKEKGVS